MNPLRASQVNGITMGLDCTSGPQELVAIHVIPSGRPQTQHR